MKSLEGVAGPSIRNDTQDYWVQFDRDRFTDLVQRDFSKVPSEAWSQVQIATTDSLAPHKYGIAFNVKKFRESKKIKSQYYIAKILTTALTMGDHRLESPTWVLDKADGKDVLIALSPDALSRPYLADDFYPQGYIFTANEVLAHEVHHVAAMLLRNNGSDINYYSRGEPAAKAYSIATSPDWENVLLINSQI